jgi:PAS domain-containing protein
MPGLGGFETARLIREHEPSRHVPIIFLTAFDADRGQVERAYALGAVDFLFKPLSAVVVRAKVAGFVDLFEKARRIRQLERHAFERQLAEGDERLRVQREWLRTTLHSIGDAVIATDTDGKVTFLNPVAESLTGWRADEAVGRPPYGRLRDRQRGDA